MITTGKFWKCMHCGQEHAVLAGGGTGYVAFCSDQRISVPAKEVFEKPVEESKNPGREGLS